MPFNNMITVSDYVLHYNLAVPNDWERECVTKYVPIKKFLAFPIVNASHKTNNKAKKKKQHTQTKLKGKQLHRSSSGPFHWRSNVCLKCAITMAFKQRKN